MHTAVYLGFKSIVDHAVDGNARQAAEGFRADTHAKVALPLRPVTGMPLVKVGFVHHIQRYRLKSLG